MAEIDYSKGKIPGAESGIEIRHSVCDICTPGMHCGLDVYVKDGKVIKVEGTPDHPQNKGKLCTKGLGNRQYPTGRTVSSPRCAGLENGAKANSSPSAGTRQSIPSRKSSSRPGRNTAPIGWPSIRDTASGTGSCSGGLPGTMAARTMALNPAAALPAA